MERVLRCAEDAQAIVLSEDAWRIWDAEDAEGAEAEADATTAAALPDDVSIWLWPLSIWQQQGERLQAQGATGLWLHTDTDMDTLTVKQLAPIQLIAVHFKVFSDGRGLSLARLLRGRFGYSGELRAVGDVLPDLLNYMVRCGFDSFALRRAEEFAAAKAALQMQAHHYQASEIEPWPLFLRKH